MKPPRSLLLATLTVFIAVALCSTTAFARHNDMEVSFDELFVKPHHTSLTIDYRLSNTSWHALQRTGIEPRLNLYLPTSRGGGAYEFAYSMELRGRSGRLVFPASVRLRNAKDVELRLVGQHRNNRIDRISYGRSCSPQLRVSVQHNPGRRIDHRDEPQPDRRDRHDRRGPTVADQQAELIALCKAHTSFSTDFNGCLDRAMRLPILTASATVQACGIHSNFSSEMTTCLDTARTFRTNPAPAIEACGESTRFSSDMRQCLTNAAAYRYDPTPVILACGEASRFSAEFHRCVESSQRTTRRRGPRL